MIVYIVVLITLMTILAGFAMGDHGAVCFEGKHSCIYSLYQIDLIVDYNILSC